MNKKGMDYSDESGMKNIYSGFADKIFEKRYNSPNPLRRYAHRAQYNSILEKIIISTLLWNYGI